MKFKKTTVWAPIKITIETDGEYFELCRQLGWAINIARTMNAPLSQTNLLIDLVDGMDGN